MKRYFLFDSSYYLMQNSFFTTSGKRCSKPVYRYEVKFMQKCGKPFSQNFSSYSKLSGFFTTSLYIIPDPVFLSMLLQERLMVFPKLFLNHQRK
ncbi:hypothetical protein CQR38_10920 [Enterococcus faecium]|nr:hypothetical protein CQR38_10920 [Enterococcus faecium]